MSKKIEVVAIATDEDKELVRLLADGNSGSKIAELLKSNENTVAFNLSVIRKKFNCRNSISLVAYFLRNKIIE